MDIIKRLHYGWAVLIFLLLFSCNKKEDSPEVEPTPEPEVEFKIPMTDDMIMYEVNLRAFSASGDLQGVIQGLDHIKSLGVNVLWLMPIHPIGDINSVNSPYSVKNYKEVCVEYGNLNDLKSLVEKAHDKNIAVILDWVANHTAWDNPWIKNKDWYTQDESGNIISPEGTNWADVADLNYDNQVMRLEMIESMKYWIENVGIDGFRCDAADMIPFDFWKQAIDALNESNEKDLIYLAEGARTDHFSAGFDLNFSWNFYSKLKDVFHGVSTPSILYAIQQQSYNNMPAGKHKLRFTTNHDESAWDATPMLLFNGKDGALAASVIAIYLGGVPLIYDGQEVGVTENIPFFNNSPIDWALNADMLDTYKKMFSFYTSSDVVKKGELITYTHPSVAVFTRTTGTGHVLVIVNTRDENTTYSMPDELDEKSWIHAIYGTSITINDHVDLSPYEYLILNNN
ncbi:MAG: alpha-amylase [Marinilabiliales bacterium]|nr:MAG: alpha-amylase [Marinilabiliales bacterium]